MCIRDSWYSYNDIRLGQGRENTKQYLREHPELTDELEAKIRANLSPENDPNSNSKEASEK